MALPVGPLHAELTLLDISPFQGHHLTAAKARFASEQHD